MTSDPSSTLSALRIPGAWSGAPPRWDEADAAMAHHAWPDGAGLQAAAARIGLDAADLQAAAAMRERLLADPHLDRLGRYIVWRTFGPEPFCDWGLPDLAAHLGTDAGAFYLCLGLLFPAALDRRHRQLGYPPGAAAETVERIRGYAWNHRRATGRPGVFPSEFGWLAHILTGPYVRLGRFEYQLNRWQGPVEAWRGPDGRWLLLAMGGLEVDADGLQALPGAACWTTARSQAGRALTAHPITGQGRIHPDPVTIDTATWRRAAGPGDDVLDIHISSGRGMDWDAVAASLRRVGPFFAAHHPERPWRAVVCSTWFLDPRLPGLLGESANPSRFQRAVGRFPTPPLPRGLWFVFLQGPDTPPDRLRRDSRLQSILADALGGGLRWHGGGCVLLPEEVADPRLDRHAAMFDALIGELAAGRT